MGKSDWAAIAAFIAGSAMNIIADQFPKWFGWALMLLALLLFVYGRIPDSWTANGRIILLVSIALVGTASICLLVHRNAAPKDQTFVSVSDAGIVTGPGGSAPTVYVVIKNTGTVPAYKLTWRASFASHEFPYAGPFEIDRKNAAASFELPPGETRLYQWKFPMWGDGNWNAIRSGKAAIFAYGEILYKDSNESKVQLCNEYRLYHGGDSFAPEGKFAVAVEGNSSNQNCDRLLR
jgi:hypothetical protein